MINRRFVILLLLAAGLTAGLKAWLQVGNSEQPAAGTDNGISGFFEPDTKSAIDAAITATHPQR